MYFVPSNRSRLTLSAAGLSGFAIFITVTGIVLSSFMLVIPVLYEKYDKFITLARALKEQRVSFILTGAGTTASILISCVTYRCLKFHHSSFQTDSSSPSQLGLSLAVKTPRRTPMRSWAMNSRTASLAGAAPRRRLQCSSGLHLVCVLNL